MKRIIAIFLMCVLCFSLCACERDNNDTNNTSETTSITYERAKSIAEQKIVNMCCEHSYVSKISMDYGTFTHSVKGGDYEFTAKGTYLPKDDHGMYGDRTKFSIRLTVNEFGNVTVNSKQFDSAY